MSSKEPEVKTKADVIDIIESVDLLEEASRAFWGLWDEMYQTCALHKAELQEMEELHKLEYVDSIRESADFVLADPPYDAEVTTKTRGPIGFGWMT